MFVPRILCMICAKEMGVVRNAYVVEMLQGNGEPYYKIYCDLYECDICCNRVALPAEKAVVAHFQPEYAVYRAESQATFR